MKNKFYIFYYYIRMYIFDMSVLKNRKNFVILKNRFYWNELNTDALSFYVKKIIQLHVI